MNNLKNIAVLMRTWNNNPHVVERTKAWLAMDIGALVIVVNDTQDPGIVAKQLASVADERLHIVSITEHHSPSRALNAGARYITEELQLPYILCTSVEALFTENHVVDMVAVVQNDIAVVGTTFSGVTDAGEPTKLPPSYFRHPLNTGALYNQTVFDEQITFDVWCDDREDAYGMEDLDMLLRAQLAYEFLDLQVPLVIGRFYNQEEKEQRRERAVAAIVARAKQQCPSQWLNKTLQQMKLHES